MSWSSVVALVTRLLAGRSGVCISTGAGIISPSPLENEPALGPTQLPVRLLLRYLKGWGVLTPYHLLSPKVRMSGVIPLLPLYALCLGQGRL